MENTGTKLKISSAAIQFEMPNGTKLIEIGFRHCQIYDGFHERRLREGLVAPVKSVEGFMTSESNFVDRVEAMKIAREAGQLKHQTDKMCLSSEDIW